MIADELEELVFSGAFQDGDRLDEIKLSKQFDVSRTPIREALQRLVRSGEKIAILDEKEWLEDVLLFVDQVKASDQPAQIVFEALGWSKERKFFPALYDELEKLRKRNNIRFFADLLSDPYELISELDDAERVRVRGLVPDFRYLLIDEFQDINDIQYAWLKVLIGNKLSLTIVGDDDQSIYGWRGAKVENIQSFEHDYQDAHVVRLEQNYRSTANILEAANAVIQNNMGRLGKDLWTDGEKGDPIRLYAAFNEQDESRYIADEMKRLIDSGVNPTQIALLYRSNAQSRVLEESLIHLQVPYRIYGGQRFYERLEIRNALAYLRLMLNQNDDPAFERVVNTPTRGIGEKTVDTVRLYARENGLSLWQSADALMNGSGLTKRAGNGLQGFLDLITLWFLNKFGKRPMHFFGLWGSFMLLAGFLFTVYLGVDKLYFDTQARLITNRPEFYIALTLMLLGSQFCIAGFLGEIILRSKRNTKRYTLKEQTPNE